jgi:hypothetical protein
VDIRFGTPIESTGRERKEVAEAAREQVAAMLTDMGVQLDVV